MNARTKAVTIWSAVCGTGLLAGLLAFTERAAETQMTIPAPPVELVSVSDQGTPPDANSSGAVASADGTCVAYYSDATDILPPGPNGDNNAFTDVYVFNRTTRVTQRVSVGTNGQDPNGPSQAQRFRPSIDSGCTCVAFSSDATNLVPDDTNGKTDVFVRDLAAATTELASVGLGDAPANGASSFTSVPSDCSKVAFHSLASNLVQGDTNNFSDVFVFERGTGMTTRVSVGPGGVEANGPSITPSFSANGHCVAFASAATNLLPTSPDTNKTLDIYVECDGVVTCRASVSSSGKEADQMSFLPALNGDGTIVAFKSNATNLVDDDFNQAADVFVHNCVTGETIRASVGDEGQEGNDIAIPPSISSDGRFVAFGSFASNLIQGVNTGGNSQVYVRDLLNQTTILISSNRKGQAGNAGVPDLPPSISPDGDWVAFDSQATNLIAANTQGFVDAYIRANVTVPPTATPTNTGPPPATSTPHIPCHENTDCPVGQVCGGEFCVPAPTPTPTIACTDTSQCPGNLQCVNGICRDLSTPTATPTPLPTCVVSADCPDGTECRAGVCVPPRPCTTETELTMCRGERETCLDDFCECGGDCNLDGIVFGSEITKMVCIMSGMCQLDTCPAGDIDRNGAVTAADVTLAVDNLGLGCPGEGSPLTFAVDRSSETRTLVVGNITGIPGENVNFDIDIAGGDEVTTAQVDILYPQALLDVPETACTLDARITGIPSSSFQAEVQLPQVPPNPSGEGRLRVAVVDKAPPIKSFGPGPLFHCQVRIQPSAAPTSSQLIYVMSVHTPEIADFAANKFNAQVTGGAITVNQSTMPCTTDDMCPTGTQCKGGVCKPIVMCNEGLNSGEQCLPPGMSRQACVNNRCVCVGDCNDDGEVGANEITIMINIINGVQPLSMCPSADFNGNDEVGANEITIAINNINEGCP